MLRFLSFSLFSLSLLYNVRNTVPYVDRSFEKENVVYCTCTLEKPPPHVVTLTLWLDDKDARLPLPPDLVARGADDPAVPGDSGARAPLEGARQADLRDLDHSGIITDCEDIMMLQ